jgi:hypothetical protein
MPLPPAAAPRERIHKRSITVEGYRRADGLWDIEGFLTDVKDHDTELSEGLKRAGDPIHQMSLRITIDAALTIVDAAAATDRMPYRGECNRITPDYAKLKGLRLVPGFSAKLKERLGGIKGCTHLTELAASLATGAYQTLAGEKIADPAKKPMHLDGCHALDTRGHVVARSYPRWHRTVVESK